MISTDQLRDRLAQRGLVVSVQTLDNDVHDGYLPGRPWHDWVLTRASRLYRLRRLGLQGDVLRLLLFLHDGYGWDGVKAVTLKGMQKLNRATQVGIRETVRDPTPASLSFVAGEAAEAQRRHLLKRLRDPETSRMQVRESTMSFIWGQGLFGKPLPQGSLETFAPLAQLFFPEISDEEAKAGISQLEEAVKLAGLTWKDYEQLVERCDETLAQEAARELWWSMRLLRGKIHESIKEHGSEYSSSNPLTLFGDWGSPRAENFWKKAPERMTPAQLLGAWLGTCIVQRSFPEILLRKFFEEMLAADAPASNHSE